MRDSIENTVLNWVECIALHLRRSNDTVDYQGDTVEVTERFTVCKLRTLRLCPRDRDNLNLIRDWVMENWNEVYRAEGGLNFRKFSDLDGATYFEVTFDCSNYSDALILANEWNQTEIFDNFNDSPLLVNSGKVTLVSK